MAYVYGLRAVDSDVYFYIGSTKHSLKHRLQQHLDNIRLGRVKNKHLVRKVNKIGAANVVIEAIIEVDEAKRFDYEYDVIHQMLLNGVKLTNVVVAQRDFEMSRRIQEFDEFELQPRHIIAILEAYENGVPRNGDKLHDAFASVIEKLSEHIMENHFEEFEKTIAEVMAKHHDGQANS